MSDERKVKRCAVYTRKSSEEGLEQDFNSLHAQREACAAYIASQRGEGWKLIETVYDDGGISGGTMDRPALQKLLNDIRDRKVDVVVVYKVDRLTRSLADFAKIVEVFDQQGVSFVAVTQQFNTTSSMGRLTLNVLLSFAQFEREVTGERIRDKIAASKKKGMWMGGSPPLGYMVQDRKLVIVPSEAETVRMLFQRYLTTSGSDELLAELRREGVTTKARVGKPSFRFRRGALYWLLSNPLYVGEIRHKGERYPGLHEPIIDADLWGKVQERLSTRAVRNQEKPARKTATSPLMGKIFEQDGRCLTPTHSAKGNRRLRYYTSSRHNRPEDQPDSGWRLPALQIEGRVEAAVQEILKDRSALAGAALSAGVPEGDLPKVLGRDWLATAAWPELVQRVDLTTAYLKVTLNLPYGPNLRLDRTFPLQMKRRGVELRLVISGAEPGVQIDPSLLKAIGRAMRWWDLLTTGQVESAVQIAKMEGFTPRYVQRLLPLALLAPDIVEDVVAGRHPPELVSGPLTHGIDLPLRWQDQRLALGMAA
ncbi:MAG TPA: recombinase family protein [Solimonas sp.]